MKTCIVLTVLIVISSVLQTCNGNCVEREREECKTIYTREIEDAGENIVELCQSIDSYQHCVERALCTVPYDMGSVIIKGEVAYKCGAAGITINVAVLLLTVFVALKNIT
ncbi:hypothetical protein LOTGIDRAFT_153268 [Lottia gigantea]|uniref:Uncharacterized protein n=1 Tax=Lottia gigantea TaxID=225164 RepID=V4AAK0_LOTGI|nr:hypothetical protein LOTGIDRAFT_153268 [Lottia gigantea]ESO93797.1 hypothetical protein LOTGIDRAFT_153268 [Lottia gigantea]